jgi:soluble lytic murein transglycosylase-like protein
MPWIFLFIILFSTRADAATCFDEAGNQYRVSPRLLGAIARHESGMNPQAVHKNRDGTRDYGLMQVNDRWIPSLRQYGITKEKLMEPCQNIYVGAMILRSLFERYGENWTAVGHYNAAHPLVAAKYAWKIHRYITRKTSLARR